MDVEVFAMDEAVTGASPPDPLGPGGPSPAGPAKADRFDLPNGTTKLVFTARLGALGSTGSARIEVYAPDGSQAYSSQTVYAAAVAATSLDESSESETVLPGTYEVQVWAGGSFQASLEALATVPRG